MKEALKLPPVAFHTRPPWSKDLILCMETDPCNVIESGLERNTEMAFFDVLFTSSPHSILKALHSY